MKSCSLPEFLEAMEPWLSKNYVRKICVEGSDRLKLIFEDGVSNVYHIDDCSRSQMDNILSGLENKGIEIDRYMK